MVCVLWGSGNDTMVLAGVEVVVTVSAECEDHNFPSEGEYFLNF